LRLSCTCTSRTAAVKARYACDVRSGWCAAVAPC
jgi:hypothetical protein